MFFLKVLFVFILFLIPYVALAQGLVPDCSPDCGFDDLMKLVGNIIEFFVLLAIPLAAISFAWAGFIYMTSGGNPGKTSKAHGIFKKVGIGLVIVLGAYTIVSVILRALTEWGSPEEIVINLI